MDSFTEADIRKVMARHRPGNEGYCLCAWSIAGPTGQEFTVEHLLEELRRDG